MNVNKQVLLITDLDNTLVGNNLATKKLNQYLCTHRLDYILAYATGRSYNSAKQLMIEQELLEPNYWITGVGTEIYAQDQLDFVWADKISVDWNRDAIASFVTTQFPQLKLQVKEEQNSWKLSFNLLDSLGTIAQLVSSLQTRQLKAQVIFSSNVDVDILPLNANKGNAVQYLQNKLGIAANRTLVCGDSGNDISMFQQPVYGVIVNNAQRELIEWYQAHADEHHYFAENTYASGILEALHKFELLIK